LVRAVLIGFIEPAWGRGLVILAAILLSIANNRFRIFTLSMLGVYVDFGFPHVWLHHQGGTMFSLERVSKIGSASHQVLMCEAG
jgi:exosortase/archaeosortase family protein